MWPSRSDMSRDECRKCLRCLELDAYGNMVSVLRAQGSFTDEKRKLLSELAKVLHISNERHRAEIRRAVNDDKLSAIAEQFNGPNACTDWAIEGRRTVPLLPRLKAHTAFTGLANSLSLVIAAANDKKLPPPSRVEDPIVKVETASHEETEQHVRATAKVPILHSETNVRGKKRKRSSPRSSDSEKCRKAQSTETTIRDPEANSISCKELRVESPLPNETSFVQVSIVTPSSTSHTTSHNDNNTHECSRKQITSTNVSNYHELMLETTNTGSHGVTNSTTIQSTANAHAIATISNNRQDITNIIGTHSVSAKSRATITNAVNNNHRTNPKVQRSIVAQVTGENNLRLEEKKSRRDNIGESVSKESTTTDGETKISRPDSTTSSTPCPKRIMTTKFCVTTKPIITSSTNRVVTVNSGSTASSGPGPPCVTPSTTLMYKKLSPSKLNHHSDTKMGITLSSNKTLRVNAHPNARLATKANVIVVQKGPSRGVTLSHGGKEVLGKVIMSGKNSLRIANQKNANSLALLPHRGGITNNGEQTLTTLNASHTESLKLGEKTGNMIVLDIRQDVLDKNKVLSQLLEASGALNNDTKTTATLTNSNNTNNHSYDFAKFVISKSPKPVTLVNSLTMELNDERETVKEPCLYSSSEAADSSDVNDNREILKRLTEEKIETHGVLDPQTGIYNYETADGIIIEEREIEDSIATSGLDIFTTALISSDINLENFHYVDNVDDEIVAVPSDETMIHSPMSVVQQLDELDDS